MRLLLDTNAYSGLVRGHDSVAMRVRRAEELILSTVVAGELLFGFRNGTQFVADRELAVAQVIRDPLIHALIPAADEREAVGRRQLPSDGLIESSTAWRQEEQRARRIHGFDRREQRLRQHHHSGAATERRIVHGVMTINCVRSGVHEPQIEMSGGAGPPDQ